MVEGKLKDKTTIRARSRQFSTDKEMKSVKEEAWENFWGRVHQHFQGGGSGNADEGKMFFKDEVVSIKEGVVQYAPV